MKHKIVNLAVFKIAWTIVVVSAAAGTPFIGVVAVAAAVAIHLHTCDNVESETRLMLVAAVMGLAWESILVLSGLVSYSSGNLVPGIAPYWIVAMWVLFATTINAGMRWLQRNKVLAAVAGGIGLILGVLLPGHRLLAAGLQTGPKKPGPSPPSRTISGTPTSLPTLAIA